MTNNMKLLKILQTGILKHLLRRNKKIMCWVYEIEVNIFDLFLVADINANEFSKSYF